MSVAETKSPGWMRAVQIGLGIIALILSAYVIAYSVVSFVAVVWIIGIVLLVVGIERVISGIFEHHPGRSRWSSIGLGILVIILALLIIAFPASVALFLIILLAIALLFDGIARLIHGISDRTRGRGSRIFRIVAGAIEIALSIAIMAAPAFGAGIVGVLMGIALLIAGIQIIVAGVTGTRFRMMGR
jgi:uncharacterized membrane protein HdeD (DUF308 family)